MIDWARNQQILVKESEPFVRQLLAETRDRGDELVAIGYVFEFGRGQLEFDLCANTAGNLNDALESLRENYPDESEDSVRWNSGDFDYPAGVSDQFGGFSRVWRAELAKLDQLAESENSRQIVYDGIVEICCQALADFARRDVIDCWQQVDLNVADLLDDVELVKDRDSYIRSMLKFVP